MSMNGTYKIYKDGKLVVEQKNKLTTLGRGNALKAMLGQNQYFANVFGIGISSKTNGTTNFLSDTDLGFTVGLYQISMGTLGTAADTVTDGLVYIARITDTSRYNINEIGLFSMMTTDTMMIDDLTIFNFEDGDSLKEIVSGTTYYVNDVNSTYLAGKAATIMEDKVNYRIGNNAIKMTGNIKTIFFDDVKQDMSDIEYSDRLVLAAYSNNALTKNVSIKFYSIATDGTPVIATYIYSLLNGYNVLSLQKNQGTNYDVIDWKAITKIEVNTPSNLAATSTATISIANPALITWNSHNFSNGDTVSFTTTGSLPTGLNTSTTYYIRDVTTNNFKLSETLDGALVVTSGTQTGTHTASASSYIIFDGFRVKQTKPIDATDGLVSRAVLATPIEKDSGSIIDIQYILSMGLDTDT